LIKKITGLLSAVFVIFVFLGTLLPTQAADHTINIVHTSDMKGTIFKNEETGTVGYGNVLSVREKLGDPLVIDCGNFLGDPSQKETNLNQKVVYAMGKAGYNYATLGYSDLRYKKAEIDELLFGTEFEVLSSNIMIGDEYAFDTIKTKMINGTKVGIFAVTDCEDIGEYKIADPEAEATKAVKRLKSGGSQVIVCVINTNNKELSEKIATANPDIAIILEGGTNNYMPQGKPIGRTLIVNPGVKANAIGVSAVTVDGGKLKSFQTSNYNLLNIKAVFPETNTLEQEMQNAQGEIDAFNNVVVAIISENLPFLEGELTSKTTPLGNFVADIIKNVARADIGLIKGSHITGGLSKEMTGFELNNLYKENDDIIVKDVTGASLYKCIEISINKLVADENGKTDYIASGSDNFLQIAGLKVKYNLKYPAGRRIVSLKTDSGKNIGQFSKTRFKVAGPASLMNSYSEYLTGAPEVSRRENMVQQTREYLTKSNDIDADMENRCEETQKGKSYLWLVLLIAGCIILAILIAYIVAQLVMFFNTRY